MAGNNKTDMGKCVFCGQKITEHTACLTSPASGPLCANCIVLCSSFMIENGIITIDDIQSKAKKNSNTKDKNKEVLSIPKPKEIFDFLDQYVIGQEQAKKYLSVAVYNHYKRLNYSTTENQSKDDVEIEKSNILMIGPTGTGKTLLAKSIARLLNVPFTIVDATVFTQAGYVGEDIESILSRLLQEADYNVKKAEKGIVFIDEIDKLSRKNDNPSITRDVGGEGVQQGMLKLLEGSIVNVPPKGGRKHPDQDYVKVDTKNILFICAGAFEGIDRIIAKRMNTSVVGYNNKPKDERLKNDDLLQYIDARDLRAYGIIPELLGRLPVITHLKPLDKDALLRIMTEPKNAIVRQFEKLLEMDGIKLTFAKDALVHIVEKSIEQKLGARGLRAIIEKIMNDVMFSLPSQGEKTFEVTKNYVLKYLD